MNIGIDGYEANTDKRVGIGQYAYQVITGLYNLDERNDYTIFLPTKALPDLPHERKNWKYIVGSPGSFWTIIQLPVLIKTQKLDIFFSPTHYVPWFTNVPKVFSIMDLSYLHFPQMFKTKDYLKLKYMTLYSVKHARKILTISEFSKQEIVKNYNVLQSDIIVTYPGFTKLELPEFHFQKDILSKYEITKRYLLFVGTLQPRKNISRLLKAFDLLNKNDVQLVLVGKKGWLYGPIFAAIEKSPRKEDILVLDFVDGTDLPTLYANATCFVLPSLHEGFGIPVAEALLYGCPVVVSNTSSLPEVAGDTGIYVNPLEVEDIALGLKKGLQLKPEARLSLSKKGQEHIKKFNWETCVKKTLETLNNL